MKGRPRIGLPHDLNTYHGRVGVKILPHPALRSRLTTMVGIHALRRIDADIDIPIAAQGIGFTGESVVLEGDAVLA
ncbi:hypothetical protein D3C85_1324750 [compost metagenome]